MKDITYIWSNAVVDNIARKVAEEPMEDMFMPDSEEESLLTTYAEDEENLCGTVYGYVPCSIIDQVIEKHGGIDESKIEALFK